MKSDLSPQTVAARLEVLRAHYVPVGPEEAHGEIVARGRPDLSPEGVARRLAELRALLELTRHLHSARR